MAKATATRQRAAATRRQRSSFTRDLRANFYDFLFLLRQSWLYLLIFALLVAGSTFYIVRFSGFPDSHNLLHALFAALQLMVFQTSNYPTDTLGQILFLVIPVVGVTLIFQSVVNFSRLLFDKSTRRESWQISLAKTYHNHIIVCGLGRLGFRVVSQLLDARYEVVVVTNDWDAPFVTRMLDLRVPVVMGDAREISILRQAGVARARAVIALVNNDLVNLEAALTARAENPNIRTVVRLFTDEMAQSVEHTLQASTGFSTSALASPTFAAATVNRNLDFVLPTGHDLIGIMEMPVVEGGPLAGKVPEIEQQQGIRVVQVCDRSRRLLQRHQVVALHSGDSAVIAGKLPALEAVRIRNTVPDGNVPATLPLQHPNEQYNTIIICGLGKVGFRVVNLLRRTYPQLRLVVIHTNDPKHQHFAQQVQQLAGVEIVIGDATDVNVLNRAGIDRAFALAALTSDDDVNLQIGQAARSCRPAGRNEVHLVLRVFSDVLAEKLSDMFGIHTAYSTSGLASPTLASAALTGDISHSFCTNGELLADRRYVVRQGDRLAQIPVGAIQSQLGLIVAGLERGGQNYILPPLDTQIAPGDALTLLGPIETLSRLR